MSESSNDPSAVAVSEMQHQQYQYQEDANPAIVGGLAPGSELMVEPVNPVDNNHQPLITCDSVPRSFHPEEQGQETDGRRQTIGQETAVDESKEQKLLEKRSDSTTDHTVDTSSHVLSAMTNGTSNNEITTPYFNTKNPAEVDKAKFSNGDVGADTSDETLLVPELARNNNIINMSGSDEDDIVCVVMPGAYYVPGRQQQQQHRSATEEEEQQEVRSDGDTTSEQQQENEDLISMDPINAEVFDEKARKKELERIKAEAMESGRQQALREMQNHPRAEEYVVPTEQSNQRMTENRSTKFVCLGLAIITIILIVVPVTVIRIRDRSLSTNKCFTSSATLVNAVDVYLQSPNNNSVIGLYGYPIGTWCVSSITQFDELFNGVRNPAAAYFDEDLSGWDVSQALSMTNMFARTQIFRGTGLNLWNVARVQNMTGMFYGARSFNANLSSWQVGNVRSMQSMFREANQFRGDGLQNWDTSNVKDMGFMFMEASIFDAELSKWNTSRVVLMLGMFARAFSFRGIGIDGWDVSKVTRLGRTFSQATSFDADLSRWNVSQVVNMDGTFADAANFTGIGVNNWDVSRVTFMPFIFKGTTKFDANLSLWDVSSVITFLSAFQFTDKFRGVGLELWNVSSAVDFFAMFSDAHAFDANLSAWNITRCSNTSLMFANATSYRGIGLHKWDVSNVRRMNYMFFSSAIQTDLSGWDVSKVSEMYVMFAFTPYFNGSGLEKWNTSLVENMEGMFLEAPMVDVDFSSWDVSNVGTMDTMFQGCSRFLGRGLDRWNVARVLTMKGMFQSTSQFDANLTLWDVSRTASMQSMFYQARKFRGLGLDNWDVERVSDMTGMFFQADVFDANLSIWNVSQVSSMSYMFYDAVSFRGTGLEQWDVSRVQDGMVGIFHGASSLLNVDLLTGTWIVGSNNANASTWFSNTSTFSGFSPSYPIPKPGRQK